MDLLSALAAVRDPLPPARHDDLNRGPGYKPIGACCGMDKVYSGQLLARPRRLVRQILWPYFGALLAGPSDLVRVHLSMQGQSKSKGAIDCSE
jgi:hypothetical protein